ncbi:MAG: bifunctional 23S rRNA (guanine(2069)-N(7))-methyltransferase RlmK/23S rRNA (guanine(2445)-N(2))-methyltransferase RlmL [Endozoicomonas sp. (ex Botrylloides leachii)]|nr:bifunctional 23S rRNA (guanine(2069)-N(7))-methyltransferase RlmK/23S rRNA (guanine(2445)-N(2))-methyltransferase RlmL [Endozoicomonas sp. (ex Botrylloides leachii)]
MTFNCFSFFASCPKGLESLLAAELTELKANTVQETVAGVSFSGNMELAYRACLWSRLASRILLRLGEVKAEQRDNLYLGVKSVDWHDHIDQFTRFRVDFSGSTPDINHTRYGAQLVKDAIVDQLQDNFGWRPTVSATNPDIRVNVHARAERAFLSIDLSGQSLHQRGYRLEAGEAPIKENLAAAILLRANWPAIAKQQGTLLDPLCGSGTLLIEAAMMAADIAPGLLRARFGFDKWLGHIPTLWLKVLEEAKARRTAGLANKLPLIIGYEGHPRVVGKARANIERAGVKSLLSIKQQELSHLKTNNVQPGLVISNPPYGERMGDGTSLIYFYRHLGEKLKAQCAGWQAGIFTAAPELCRSMALSPRKQYSLFNSTLPCKLFLYDIHEHQTGVTPEEKKQPAKILTTGSPGGLMFANRLTKNRRIIGKWARKQGIECYRLYDADMPEYALAVDLYHDWVHVQEYSAPASIQPEKAQRRLLEALEVIPSVLDVPENHVIFKRRERQSGNKQYKRQGESGEMLEVKEGKCRLLVNLKDYLDTGLFLDHRLMRQRIGREAEGKDILNLFCYTATASVHAGVAGAASTTSVDLSNSYLIWARKNFSLNGLATNKHRLERADCLDWLAIEKQQYDLIFMDPPTFSNSKRTKQPFEIQSAHTRLIELAMKRLRTDGVLYFSNNFRSFKLDKKLETQYMIQEITATTIDKDFQRTPNIHRCWSVKHLVH